MKVLRSIPNTISAIQSVYDIPKLVEYADELIPLFTPDSAEQYFKTDYLPVQYAALAYIIPVNYYPLGTFNAIKSSLKIFDDLEPKYQTGLMMRFSNSAVLSGKYEEALSIIEVLMKKSPADMAAPYLFLTASINKPVDIIPEANKNNRIFSLSLYYATINQILLKNYRKGRDLIFHCLHLPCPQDMQSNVINTFSALAYLTHMEKDQFIFFIPPKASIDKDTLEIWDGRKFLWPQQHNFSEVYRILWKEITDERIRRGILTFARSTSRMPFSMLCENCGCYDEEKVKTILNTLKDQSLIDFEHEEKVITFTYISLTQLIEQATLDATKDLCIYN